MRLVFFSLAFLISLTCCANISWANSTIYVYEKPNGNKVITDNQIHKKGYILKRRYNNNAAQSGNIQSPYFAKPIASKYDALIVNMALKYALEPSFIKAVIHVESAFNEYALSKAGAMGLMQLMPATAARYQLKQNHFNPNLNIEAGVQHIKDLVLRYDNDKKLILAAYNAGAGAVNKHQGVPPYAETQNYIKKVMTLYALYKKEI